MRPADLWLDLAAVPLHYSLTVEVDGFDAVVVGVGPTSEGNAVLELELSDDVAVVPLEPAAEMLEAAAEAASVPPALARTVWAAMAAASGATE